MHSTKLFNFKYLMQNFKKSKGLIILLTILVPMFTSIMLISIDGTYAIKFIELSAVNIVGMYIIPIVLSMALFNYVYKKPSVDFVGSMPLSRKTIFLTNTLGGIALIFVMQLLNLICTLFLSQVLNSVIIFASMAWDIFIFFTISYIFVFTISNLAMSFSGNKFSQLVSICLITFLIPFLMMSCELLGEDYYYTSSSLTSSLESANNVEIEQNIYYTAPSYFFGMLNGSQYEYQSESVVKMLVLSIVYIVIGLILFNRKKLEMAGESYENIWVHLVVKLLTFVPFMFVFCAMDSTDRWNIALFFIAILAVYYFVFDLITNKKVKLKISIPAFIISTVVVFAIYEGIIPKAGSLGVKTIKIEDIKSVYIDTVYASGNYGLDFDLKIQDKELINLIATCENRYYTSESISSESLEITYPYETYKEPVKIADKGSNAKIKLQLKNGKTYEYIAYLNNDIYNKIFEKYGNKKCTLETSNLIPVINNVKLSDTEKTKILEAMKKDVQNITYEELYNIYMGEKEPYKLYMYKYENHKLMRANVDLSGFTNLRAEAANLQRKQMVANFESCYNFYYEDDNTALLEILEKYNPELANLDNSYEVVKDITYDIMYSARDSIKEFIKADANKKIDLSKEYIIISSNYPKYYYYTNDIDGFYMTIAKAFNAENYDYNIKLNENI